MVHAKSPKTVMPPKPKVPETKTRARKSARNLQRKYENSSARGGAAHATAGAGTRTGSTAQRDFTAERATVR
jgi:hypothetical protein